MPHWRLFYHLVWATRDRTPLLTGRASVQALEKTLEATCRDLQIKVHAIGTMPDHVHLACSIPPSLSMADAVKRLKGTSSHLLNQTIFAEEDDHFSWQAEYGAYTFTERALPDVVAYINNQEARHAAGELWSGFEQTESQVPTRVEMRLDH